MKIHFVSFAAGTTQFREAARRIKKEANESRYFDEIHVFDEYDTLPILKKYLETNSNILKKRGYGYWAWKPYLILDIFNKASIGDIICYADSGCQISTEAYNKFKENIKICKKNKTLFYNLPGILEKNYTKYKLFEYFKCEDREEYINTPQIQATYFYLEVCNENLTLVKKWAEICTINNFTFSDDSDSIGIDNTFIEHRHDQSILSLLVKKLKIKTYPHEDNFEEEEYYINSKIMLFPVHSLRNRGGTIKHIHAFKYSNKKIINSNKLIYKILNIIFHLFDKKIKKFFNVMRILLKIKEKLRN